MGVRVSLGVWFDHDECKTHTTKAPSWAAPDSEGWVYCVQWTCSKQGELFQVPSQDEVFNL